MDTLLIAKSGETDAQWLSLRDHLRDTAEIIDKILDAFVSDSFADAVGVTQHQLKQTAIFLAMTHDMGKATLVFQQNIAYHVPVRRLALEHYGLRFSECMEQYADRYDTPHALAGEVILRYLGCPPEIAAIVGAHHGVPTECHQIREQDLTQDSKDILGYHNYFGLCANENRRILEGMWRQILGRALDRAKLDSLDQLPKYLSAHGQMLLTGLLIMADWIASNTTYFPLSHVEDDPEELDAASRAAAAWEQMDFPAMWQSLRISYSDLEFRSVFGFLPNAIQQATVQIATNAAAPGLLILEAPMGCGKTEAALAAAELMAAKLRKNGLFFGLPTQATANGIFPRILKWGEGQSEDDYHSIQLKHASAELNPAFQEIQRGIPVDADSDSGLVVHSWFCENKKACLAGFVVATVDQMLMAALKRRHLMLLHLGLSEKVVIIDEVHAYDAYMNQYLERALQWLGAYHTPVILLSATLPAQRRAALVKAYLDRPIDPAIAKTQIYPLLTWTDGRKALQQPLPYTGGKKVVEMKTLSDDQILATVQQAIEQGACVGLILNTVKRAQETAQAIRSALAQQVLLYHAQYLSPDRAKKESQLTARIGKYSTADTRKGVVVVGTQVLEQSLDIDFDLLITDLCPMDLLLQRLGRLHRHSRPQRPSVVETPICYVLTDVMDEKHAGTRAIYGDWLLQETQKRIPPTITLPDDISPLVQAVYQAKDNSETYRQYCTQLESAQKRAKTFLLERPDHDDTIHGMLVQQNTGGDSAAEAAVRDGIASLEILAMERHPDDTIYFLDGTPLSAVPSQAEYMAIAAQKLRLPSRFCHPWCIDQVIQELEAQTLAYGAAWQGSRWIKGKLVLFFRPNKTASLMGYRLAYSQDLGLTYTLECPDPGSGDHQYPSALRTRAQAENL